MKVSPCILSPASNDTYSLNNTKDPYRHMKICEKNEKNGGISLKQISLLMVFILGNNPFFAWKTRFFCYLGDFSLLRPLNIVDNNV